MLLYFSISTALILHYFYNLELFFLPSVFSLSMPNYKQFYHVATLTKERLVLLHYLWTFKYKYVNIYTCTDVYTVNYGIIKGLLP